MLNVVMLSVFTLSVVAPFNVSHTMLIFFMKIKKEISFRENDRYMKAIDIMHKQAANSLPPSPASRAAK